MIWMSGRPYSFTFTKRPSYAKSIRTGCHDSPWLSSVVPGRCRDSHGATAWQVLTALTPFDASNMQSNYCDSAPSGSLSCYRKWLLSLSIIKLALGSSPYDVLDNTKTGTTLKVINITYGNKFRHLRNVSYASSVNYQILCNLTHNKLLTQ